MTEPVKRARNTSLDVTNPPPEAKRAQQPIMAEKGHTSPFLPMFEGFKAELDEHHDRRERVIKTSRDVTATSKKVIFALQRFPVSSLAKPLPAFVSKSVDPLLETIKNLLTTITPDLQDMNGWRYQRQISPGLQEFIEAVAFRHYLTTQRLLTVEDARALLPTGIMLTVEDWALGIFDTIGEIMRWTITGIATGREIPGTGEQDGLGRHTLMDLRLLRVHLDLINAKGSGLSRDLHKKQEVMRQCVDKVEKAAYELTVRGKERPKGWVPEDGKQDARVEVESY